VVVVVKTDETKIVEFYSWSICPSGAMTLGRATQRTAPLNAVWASVILQNILAPYTRYFLDLSTESDK
jgi:hypothetical protein